MKPILKQPKIDTETKWEEKEYIRRLMKVVSLNMDMPEEKEKIGIISWLFIVVVMVIGAWWLWIVVERIGRG